jgi:hypothetical protein
MKSRPVNKPSFEKKFSEVIASAKIEGIRFDKNSQARIKMIAHSRQKTASR